VGYVIFANIFRVRKAAQIENALVVGFIRETLRQTKGKEKLLMKEISELTMPDDLRYADDHEWARVEGDHIAVGLDDYAQDQLGDIVFAELPQVGDSFKKGEVFATVESVKAVCECYLPVSGEIIAANTRLEESPELINKSPYGDGWMVHVKATDLSEMDRLMTPVVCL
jgi:glycine cleavage system H protein